MRYYFKIAIRNALRNGTLSFAKLFGISISFAVILFAAGYAYYETSFDKSIPDYDRIYRCVIDAKLIGDELSSPVTSPPMAEAITSEIPEITQAVRIYGGGGVSVTYDNETSNWGQMIYADPEFFPFFSIPLTSGSENPLASQNDLVIVRSLAEKYFGSAEEALGKEVKMRGDISIITGVFDDLPKNFHLQPKLVQSIEKTNPDEVGWTSQSYYTYFKTNGADINIDTLSFKITKTVYIHADVDSRIDAVHARTWDDLMFAPGVYAFYKAEPLTDIHFSKHRFDNAITANKIYVYGAIVLAVLILVISSVNLINLTIANISTRLKEVGIRKTTGAGNLNVVKQFLYESLLFLLAGFILAVIIYRLAEVPLTQYLNLDIGLTNKGLLKIMLLVFAALLLFNLVAVFFPVTVFVNRRIQSLIHEERGAKSRFALNHYFVLLQFVLSGLIILSSLFTHKQINFMVNKDRGYDSDNIISLVMWEMHPETRRSMLEELRTYNSIQSVSTSDRYFGEDPGMSDAYFETKEDLNYFHTTILPVDDAFKSTFDLEMKEGRFFEKDRQTDFDAAILNEAAMNFYSRGSMVGKDLIVGDKTYHVIGVVKDFNFRSLHHSIEPLVITRVENFGNVFIKIANNMIPEALEILQKLWKKYNIEAQLNYTFHDAVLAAHYMKDQQAKKLLLVLSLISIAIACVGLYAISFFAIVKRTKEIGIRKVNGAKVSEVVTMLNRDFVKWVAIAFVIAIPIAWYAMNKWLQNFAYKTGLSWWVFVLAGMLALVIALLTVSWQSWRAASRNPVEALRYE